MRASVVSFSALAALAALSCGAPAEVVQPAYQGVPAASSVAPAPPPRARVSGCQATPSTVYGAEPVVFEVSGEGAAGQSVAAELFDERERQVNAGALAVPGRLRLDDVPSGDFTLRVGREQVSCAVTVNRELSRESSPPRP